MSPHVRAARDELNLNWKWFFYDRQVEEVFPHPSFPISQLLENARVGVADYPGNLDIVSDPRKH